MSHYIKGNTPLETYQKLIDHFVYNDNGYEMKGGGSTKGLPFLGVYATDVTVEIEHLEIWDLEVSWTGYVFPARWGKLLRDYVYPGDAANFIDHARALRSVRNRGAEAGMNFGTDQPRYYINGPCLNGMTFQYAPTPRLHMFSRTSDVAPTGVLDLSLAHAFQHQINPERGRLVWTVSLMKFNAITALLWYEAWGLTWPTDTYVGKLLTLSRERLLARMEDPTLDTSFVFKSTERRMRKLWETPLADRTLVMLADFPTNFLRNPNNVLPSTIPTLPKGVDLSLLKHRSSGVV